MITNQININDKIKSVYIHNLVPGLCDLDTNDEHYGSSAVCDIAALQALSSRIHYGKFVAEAKFQANLERYRWFKALTRSFVGRAKRR